MAIRSNQMSNIRIVVAGDTGTGKSSLILTAMSKKFPIQVPPVLPPSHLLHNFPDRVPITIIDTPSGPEHSDERAAEFKHADCVVLTYACDRLDTVDNLTSYWLPELRRLKVKVPVVLVACKCDLRVHQQLSTKLLFSIMDQFREIDCCLQCSASKLAKATSIFCYAQTAALYPTPPLFDQITSTLTPQFLKALKRIFLLCDLDKDGALSDAELNFFQVKCFSPPLWPSATAIASVKRDVCRKVPDGVNEHGITWKGFLCLNECFIEEGGMSMAWNVPWKFGYNNELRLVDNFLPSSFKPAPDQSVELTNVALNFLRGTFSMYDKDYDGAIRPTDVEDLFSTAPDCPWSECPYMDATSTTALGGLTLNGFLSEWVLMTLLEPAKSVEYLKYIMYDGDAASAIHLAGKKWTGSKKRQPGKTVYQCFVFGPTKAGKSALLDDFLGRPFSDASMPNTEDRYAVNVVDGTAGSQKFVVMREIPEAKVKDLLSDKESLATCDVALFVYDSTDESSFKKTAKLLAEVARHGEDTGYKVHSLIVSAKDDLDSYTKSIKDSTWLSQDMGIDAPVTISAKRGDVDDIFQRIVTTAELPHLGTPETEVGSSRNQYYLRRVDPSLIADSVGAAGWQCRIGCLSCLFFFLGD